MNSFADRIQRFFSQRGKVSEELFDELSDLLVEGDFGAAEACKVVEDLREKCRKENLSSPEDVRRGLSDILEAMLCKAPSDGPFAGEKLKVILLLGVNGVGKTTTAAKLAELGKQKGRRPILAAADTFRAAAVDQLKIHGERLGVRVVAHQQGGDPAAVVYDAIEAAGTAEDAVIIADTAGRMHTKAALVEELKKIDRVVESRAASSRYIKYLVLDATTGRNALSQAEIFHQAVNIDGVILTKCDSSARGGVVFSLSAALSLPVVFTCNGEKYGDIREFDPPSYAASFAGLPSS